MSTSIEISNRIIKLIKSGEINKPDLIKIFSQLMYDEIFTNEEIMVLFEDIRDYFNLQNLYTYRKGKINPITGRDYSYNWINSLKNGDNLSINSADKILFTVIDGKKYFVDNE